MSGNIEIELAARNLVQVDLGGDQALAAFERSSQDFPERRDDHAASVVQNCVRRIALDRIEIGRAVGASEVLAGADYKATSFIRDVAHAHAPHLALVDRGGTPDLHATSVKILAEHRHVVLPADGRAQAADLGVHQRHSRAVAEAPDQALTGGRHQLAMLSYQPAAGHKNECGTVERSLIALDRTDDDVQIKLVAPGSDLLRLRPRTENGRVPVATK